MKVSVIIPTYNRRKLLVRAIDSVLKQTLRPLEVIVVDDHSDFDVKQYLNHFYKNNIIKVIINPKNFGAAKSRNIGVGRANSEYVAFLDSDDYWNPVKLEKQMEIAKAHPDAGLIYCDQWIVDKTKTIHESHKKLIDRDIWNYLLQGWTAPNTSTLLFKKDVFQKLGGFDSELTSCQDHDLWMRLALRDIKVKHSPERLSYFTQEAENRISLNYYNRVKGAEKFLDKWKEEIIVSQGPKYYNWFRNDYLNKVVFPIFSSAIKNRHFITALKIYAEYLVFNPVFYKKIAKGVLKRAYME